MSPNLKSLIEELSGVLKKHNACIYVSADYNIIIQMPGEGTHSVDKLYIDKDYIDSDDLDELSGSSWPSAVDWFIL